MSALTDPETWDAVAKQIRPHPYEYDLSDSSHLLDVVQIVCEAAAKVVGADVIVEWRDLPLTAREGRKLQHAIRFAPTTTEATS